MGDFWGILVGRANTASTKSFDNVSYHVLLFSVVALEMGFLKDGKAPDPYLHPHPTALHPLNTHTHHGPTLLWNNILVRQQDCGLQGGMLSRRTGASHLYGLQCVWEILIHFPSPSTPLCRPHNHCLAATFHYKVT